MKKVRMIGVSLLLSAVMAYSQTLPEAVDQPSLIFSTSGDADWFGQTAITHDGIDAARSGALEYGEISSLSTTIQGPAEVSFYWQMQTSEEEVGSGSEFSFQVDGTSVNSLNYSTGWQLITVLVHSPNMVDLTWMYEHGAQFEYQEDIGWVDELMITPTNNLPPYIYEQPDSGIGVLSNDTVMLEVEAYGDSLSYQWYEGASGNTNAPVSGATTASYTTPALTSNTLYWVRVSNPYGTDDSATAELLVYHEIYTLADLQQTGSGINGWNDDDAYILMNNIDCASLPSNPGSVISDFYGLFDGGGFVLSNLCLDAVGGGNAGLISRNYGHIERVGIAMMCITNAGNNAGGICAENYGTIRECFVDGSLAAEGAGYNLGLLCGKNYGPNQGPGIIEDCYSSGMLQVTNASRAGGLIGHNGGEVRRCYSVVKVENLGGSEDLGALIGHEGGNSDVETSYVYYWFGSPGPAATLFSNEMDDAASYVGFDFDSGTLDGSNDIWTAASGDCPKLAWQAGTGPAVPTYVPATTLSGNGTPTDPFVISSLADFHEFAGNSGLSLGFYRLDTHLDLSGTNYSAPVINRPFGGEFDGNEHSISNLYIDATGLNSSGLFAINQGTIQDLGVIDFVITNAASLAGGLCAENFGTIRRSVAEGELYGTTSALDSSGILCGQNYGPNHSPGPGVIEDCRSDGTLTGYNSVNKVGGLVGHNGGDLQRCYTLTELQVVPGTGDAGALAGKEGGNSDITNAYINAWAGLPGSATPLYPSEFVDAASFVGFDFAGGSGDGTNEVWDLVSGHGPILSWESGDGPLPPAGPATTLTGEGSSGLPFLINSLADFYEFGGNSNLSLGYYLLNTNLDLLGTNYSTAVVDRDFYGTFDGNGNVLSNLTIDASVSGADYVGLFSSLYGGIQNLYLENISITGSSSIAIGGLCGNASGVLISNCVVTGTIEGNNSNVGGVCGYMNNESLLIRCGTDVDVSGYQYVGGVCGNSYSSDLFECYATGAVEGYRYVGGLLGRQYYRFVANSYAAGDVTASYNSGGFCGEHRYGTQSNCYSIGTVSGLSNTGGFLGARFGGTFTNCYFYDDAGTDNGDETPLSASQLQVAASFSGFDFVGNALDGNQDIWDIVSGYTPKLAWQTGDGPLPPMALLTFESWVIDQGIPGGQQGVEDDPAGDGMANLLKYTSGLTATQEVAGSELFQIDPTATNEFTILFQRAKDVSDAVVEPVQSSILPGTWSTNGVTETLLSEDAALEYWKASIPVTSNGYMRLRATK